jgi:hypothetical protein
MLHQFSFLTALMLSIIIPGGLALQYFNGSPMHTYVSPSRPSLYNCVDETGQVTSRERAC